MDLEARPRKRRRQRSEASDAAAAASASSLAGLPDELLRHVINCLGPVDAILRCRVHQVSRRLREIAASVEYESLDMGFTAAEKALWDSDMLSRRKKILGHFAAHMPAAQLERLSSVTLHMVDTEDTFRNLQLLAALAHTSPDVSSVSVVLEGPRTNESEDEDLYPEFDHRPSAVGLLVALAPFTKLESLLIDGHWNAKSMNIREIANSWREPVAEDLVSFLGDAPALLTLRLPNVTSRVSKRWLLAVAKAAPQLRSLEVSVDSREAAAGFAALASFEQLEELRVSVDSQVDLGPLATAPLAATLRVLSLSFGAHRPRGLHLLPQLAELRSLSLKVHAGDLAALKDIGRLPKLGELSLDLQDLDREHRAAAKALAAGLLTAHSLFSLDLRASGVGVAVFAFARSARRLLHNVDLDFSRSPFNEASREALIALAGCLGRRKGCPRLSSFRLRVCASDYKDLRPLASLVPVHARLGTRLHVAVESPDSLGYGSQFDETTKALLSGWFPGDSHSIEILDPRQ